MNFAAVALLLFVSVIVFGLGLVAVLARYYKVKVPVSHLPYKRKKLLSKGEFAFFLTLQQAVYGKYYVDCKPRLADIIEIDGGFLWELFRPIAQKHVDFVLCDQQLNTLLIVELDDRTHQRRERQQRDRFVDEALTAAGIPVLHWPTQAAYNPKELARAIERRIRDTG